jgi:hypothetical protein
MEKKSKTGDDKIAVRSALKKLTENRNRVQTLLFEVVGFRGRVTAETNETLRKSFLLLVGASFSLWRAVFLTDPDRSDKAILGHALDFLDTVVADNAIGYPTEKRDQNWAVGYYLNNAMYRLRDIGDRLEMSGLRNLRRGQNGTKRGLANDDPMLVWEELFRAADSAKNELDKRIRV